MSDSLSSSPASIHSDAPILGFAAVVFACVVWVVAVVVLFPRLLGRLCAFLANRTSRGAFIVSIPTLHIYPLAGRAVAHSVRFTNRDATFAIEELVLQVRWWRKAQNISLQNKPLTVDNPHTLEPLSLAQQQADRENAAFFLKRLWYRLRRWWRRTASTKDPTSTTEPPPLISLICVGLSARIINQERSYDTIQKVLAFAKTNASQSTYSAKSDQATPAPGPQPDSPNASFQQLDSPSSSHSDGSVDEKPFVDRMLEFSSLRINNGAFYVCDMAKTPLIRLTVDSAKIRYRYGAPSCDADECRKRFRVGASGLRLSVAAHSSVLDIVDPSRTLDLSRGSEDRHTSRDSAPSLEVTNRMIARVISRGYRGISEPLHVASDQNRSEPKDRSRSRQRRYRNGLPGCGTPKRDSRDVQKKVALSCVDVLRSNSAVIEYVFDEPGPSPSNPPSSPKYRESRPASPEASQEDIHPLPPPVCRVSVLLHGTEITYDVGAVADIERVIERLQPLLYDLLPLAQRVQVSDGKRMVTGLQLDINITPKQPKLKDSSSTTLPLLCIPFTPKANNWIGLSATKVREWRRSIVKQENSLIESGESQLPRSQLVLFASRMEVHTEIPFQSGVQQTADVSLKNVRLESRGVVDVPLLQTKRAKITRVVHFPSVWNEEHVVSTDITVFNSEMFYVPDTIRIIDDLTTTIRDESKKPEDVNYFVPFRETTKIRAYDNFSVTLSCSRENAWESVHEQISDKYGRIKISGKSGELQLAPNVPTEFHPDATVLSWSLTVPNALASLELMMATVDNSEQGERKSDLRRSSHVNSESSRTAHQKLRPPSIARRVRSQLELLAGHGQSSTSTSKKTNSERVEFPFARFGKLCKFSGKIVANEDRRYLGTSFPAFLDAVNTNDMNLNTSSVTLDINPHHASHFLNLIKNYSGPGCNILTTAERSKLEQRRHRIAKNLVSDARYPNVRECLVLGLPAGYTLPPSDSRTAMDDILRMTFHIEYFTMRLHALPHALSPFDSNSREVCSFETSKLLGSLSANRLGLDLKFSPSPTNNEIVVRSGLVPGENDHEAVTSSGSRMTPTMTIQKLRIHKRSLSSSCWGSYYSNLRVSVAKLTGCLLDSTALFLSQMTTSFIPDGGSEDVLSIASLLSVDNIDLDVAKVDLLLLSPSSISAIDKSGQLQVFTRSKESRVHRRETFSPVPKFLVGVTQFKLQNGFRAVVSTLSTAHEGFRVRLVMPDIAFQTFVPSGGKLTPWVDDATLRAQVGHGSLTNHSSRQDLPSEIGVLRKAAEIQEFTLDILFTAKPLLWSRQASRLQKTHISEQSRLVRNEIPPWCKSSFHSLDPRNERATHHDDLKAEWWYFLKNAHQASMLQSRLKRGYAAQCRTDALSIVLVSTFEIILSTEFFDFTNDIIARVKEETCQWEATNVELKGEEAIRFRHETLSSDFLKLWNLFEKSQPTDLLVAQKNSPSTSFKAIESKGVKIKLLAPSFMEENIRVDTYALPKEGDELVFFSFPSGVAGLQTLRTDVSNTMGPDRGITIRGNPTMTRVNVFRGSFNSLAVGWNRHDLVNVERVVMITREKMALGAFHSGTMETRESRRRIRRTVVGRLGSFHFGGRQGSLDLYGSFGRIASVYVLVMRALNLELVSLHDIQRARLERLCEMMLSSTVDEVLKREPAGLRGFLTSVVTSILVRQRDRSSQDHVAVSDYALPSLNAVDAQVEIPMLSEVNSMDLSLRNVILTISGENIIQSDVLTCKGGSTMSLDSPRSELDGYILNAAVGTLSLSLRDDVATETLGMVSTVASFTKRSTLSIPTLRQDGQWTTYPRANPSEMLSFNYEGNNFFGKETTRNPRRSQDRRTPEQFRFRTRLPSPRSRTEPKRRQRHHSHSFHAQLNARESISIGDTGLGRRFSLQARPVEHNFSMKTQEPNFKHTETQAFDNFDSPTRPEHPWERSPSPRRLPPELDINSRSAGTERQVIDYSTTLEGKKYVCVAIRTAGESGPPRKKYKCMIPVSLHMPPAFIQDVEQREHRKTPNKVHESEKKRIGSAQQRNDRPSSPLGIGDMTQQLRETTSVMTHLPMISIDRYSAQLRKKREQEKAKNVTLFFSCKEIASNYYRARDLPSGNEHSREKVADMACIIHAPRLTFMSAPDQQSYSIVVTASSVTLASSNHPNCSLTGSIAKIGMTISIARAHQVSTLPRLLSSSRVSDFKVTLHAGDLMSVRRFREEFKKDMKALVSAFLRTKHSISEMTSVTRLSSSKAHQQSLATFSAMAFDVLFERSTIRLEGFHPKDNQMSISYVVDGIFFSLMASEDENAALTLGLRVYGHGLRLSSPEWLSNEYFNFPSLDARGVQWIEATGLPTILKVTADPLRNATSFQGLRHVLFTLSGLLAFQNTSTIPSVQDTYSENQRIANLRQGEQTDEALSTDNGTNNNSNNANTPFSRSIAAWERTKRVRMDICIRPLSLSLRSGQVVAVFDVDTITGIFEWNKLVLSGVQLHTAIGVPRVSLSFMRVSTADNSSLDTRPDEKKTSLSIVLERSRVDLLKTQKELTHTFVFRVDIFAVSGQIRPWKLLLDAAVWADEQELVSELQSINYKALSKSRQRDLGSAAAKDTGRDLEHRVILLGANVQRFILAVPLLNSEQHLSSRLALRATELHLFARQKFDSLSAPARNIVEVKSHFIGVLWENSSLLSSHHARVTLGTRSPSLNSNAHFGVLDIVVVPGTWRVCPRKDVVLAILDAKNKKDNTRDLNKADTLTGERFETRSISESIGADSVSNATEKQGRLLVETLNLRILKTSGFIEGLVGDNEKLKSSKGEETQRKKQSAKLSVPAFSVSTVRLPEHDFDLIDVDFSGRDGEFPRSCLQQVSNLFSDLFGAVALDQARFGNTAAEEPREISRNVSILIRFGRSLYRAQEGASLSVESKLGLFAGKASALLVSVTTSPVIDETDSSHTTVISGASPKLALEITPLLEGAQVQSLRLVDARLLHGISPCHPPHSILHVSRVTALMEAKTVLLTQNRLKLQDLSGDSLPGQAKVSSLSSTGTGERNMIFVLGKPRMRNKSIDVASGTELPRETRSEPDIRLQVKLSSNSDNDGNQVDLCVERLHLGLNCIRQSGQIIVTPVHLHGALHDVFLRGKWENLSCKLRLRENLLNFSSSGAPTSLGGSSSVANIMNRLYFECLQYDKHTLKLDVDAVATSWCAPKREVIFDSTMVDSEVSHTLQNALGKLLSQVKKLRNQVKFVTDKELGRITKRSGSASSLSLENRAGETSSRVQSKRRERGDYLDRGSSGSVSSGLSGPMLHGRRARGVTDKTSVSIRGDQLVVRMRGYQFEETRHSAVVSIDKYGMTHRYDYDESIGAESRVLDLDFEEMRFSFKDDERGIYSDLCRIPSPKVHLSMRDSESGLEVELDGDLEVKLGHGFYYWKDFKVLSEQTVQGIVPRGGIEAEHTASSSDVQPRSELWDGQEPNITVRLNPRIDVIGPDLTSDVLQLSAARLGNVEQTIPKHMYDYVVIPLEAFSKALSDPLFK